MRIRDCECCALMLIRKKDSKIDNVKHSLP